jgi:hypothetical protein
MAGKIAFITSKQRDPAYGMVERVVSSANHTIAEPLVSFNEMATHAHIGTQTVLNWLNEDRSLLIASHHKPEEEPQELLRASPGGTAEAQPATLLIAAGEPEKTDESCPAPSTLWKRLFTKPKDAAS